MQKKGAIKKKDLWQAAFLVLVFVLTAYSVLHGEDLGQIAASLKQAVPGYWVVGVVLVVLFILSESVIIWYLMRTARQKVKFGHCCMYSFVGFFFSAVTPSATGGQPAQLYFMKKDRLPVSISTLVLMIVTITYKAVLVVIGLAVLILRPVAIMKYLQPVIGWCYLGIILNVACVWFMLELVFHPTLARKILAWVIQCIGRLLHWKRKDEFLQRMERSMDRYCEVAVYYREHKRVILNVFGITMIQRILLFFITWLVYRSFGLKEAGVAVIVTLQGMISVAVDMLPLPGGMGISENLFLRMFKPLCGSEYNLPVMLVSRGISYYTQLLISGVMTVLAYLKLGRSSRAE